MEKGLYNKVANMTLLELKEEYYLCDDDDTVKKQILKKLIKNKKIDEEKKKINDEKLRADVDKNLSKIIKLKEMREREKKIEEYENLMKKRGTMEKYWESNKGEKMIDPRFKTELEQDHTNNKLMERLNCELDFRINEKTKSRDVVKPYSSANDGNYVEFEKTAITPTNFSSKRLLR